MSATLPVVYLTRHGETAWTRARRWQGQHDLPLTAVGEAQATATARRLMVERPVALFSSEATKCYYSTPFWFKMSSLILVTLFTYTIRRRVLQAPEGQVRRPIAGLVAITSMVLWLCVGAGGRWIGFSG